MHRYLNFLDTTLHFEIDPDAEKAFEPVGRFFRHTMADLPAQEPAFHLSVIPYDPVAQPPEGRPVVIRQSTAPEFTFHALLSRHGRRLVYANGSTRLDVPVDTADDQRFEVGITDGSWCQLLDFIRDLIIRTEETRGTVVLHAAGVHRDGAAYAIAGPKGAGKTTTLLSVLSRPGWQYFTGDKLFCRIEDGAVVAHPWRDYPYVGAGTIREHPELVTWVTDSVEPGLANLPDRRKLLLDVDVFEAWLGSPFTPEPRRLAGLLLPRVDPQEPFAVESVDALSARWMELNRIVDRSVDTTFFGWQHYLVPDYAAFYATLSAMRPLLADLSVLRLTGALDVDLDAALDVAPAAGA
ncbi:hypothetical protein OG762_39140 [Streptomyces sp. NBC_01136]|uniref:hypothetical protein n=1 Tax=unclassified Streptomyces TaxID=2593676 RepID=UPI003247BE9A|nr:hypothetical protein OG762_39140 [Streptomyces sp. NBC_01136]